MPSFLSSQSSYGRAAEAPFIPYPIDYAIEAGIGKNAVDSPIPVDNKAGINLKRAPFDETTAQKITDKYGNFINSVFEEHKDNPASPEAQRKMNAGKNAFKNDQFIQTVTRNAENYEAYLKDRATATNRSKDIDFSPGSPDNSLTRDQQLPPGQTWTPRLGKVPRQFTDRLEKMKQNELRKRRP